MKHLILILILFLLHGHISCKYNSFTHKPHNQFINYNIPLDKLVKSLKISKTHARIHISKLKYLLSIQVDKKTIKSYPIVLGTNPVDDKLREGDRCTPEGVFKIRAKYPHESWSKFIWFDYPNESSEKKFNHSKKVKKIPAESTIGGDVGIHGVPDGADYVIDKRQNWTWGCVSLKTNDINELYEFVFIGMIVEIVKN